MPTTTKITWNVVIKEYHANGAVLDKNILDGSANAVATELKARITLMSDRLATGDITVDEWYYSMQVNTKFLAGAERALARGGWDKMKQKDWDAASDDAFEQWEGRNAKIITLSNGQTYNRHGFSGLRKFAEDIKNGRYGNGELTDGFLARAGSYADAAYSHYVNARIQAHKEIGYQFAERLLGDIDNCPDCIAWAALGRIPIEEMESNFPMGSSICGVHCGCAITFYRTMDS